MPPPSRQNSPSSARNGRSSRKKLLFKTSIVVGLMLSAYHVLWQYWLAGYNIPEIEIDPITGKKRVRRRPDLLVKRDFNAGKDVPTSPFDGIMEGYLSLIDITIPPQGLKTVNDQLYSGVVGTFCHVAWNLQAADPTTVPMFHDIKDQSPLCLGTRYTADLYQISQQAQAYDQRNFTFAAVTMPRQGQGPVPPTAVVFHETRCGSTLTANILASFSPSQTRVYTEAPPPFTALTVCEGYDCDDGAQVQLIRDVFYLMGRITRPIRPQYVFYKIQSIGVHHMDVFRQAMPDTPWLYVYRDSVEVMMSHFKNYLHDSSSSTKEFVPNCLRNYGKTSDEQPPAVMQVITTSGRTLDSLSREEYCAAHLASLSASAIEAHRNSIVGANDNNNNNAVRHWFVNYKYLPYKIWETILPSLVGPLPQEQIQRMHEVGKLYAKSRDRDHKNSKGGQHWHEDSTLKQGKAPASVKNAAKVFMNPLFSQLERIRVELDHVQHR